VEIEGSGEETSSKWANPCFSCSKICSANQSFVHTELGMEFNVSICLFVVELRG